MSHPDVASVYAQLLSVGLVWVSVHCAGMCGPLLAGLDVAGAGCGASVARGALAVLAYQAGRALTYAGLGALAGGLAQVVAAALTGAGAALSLVLGGALIAVAARKLMPVPARPLAIGRGRRGPLVAVTSMLQEVLMPLSTGTGLLRPLALGAALGFLPCMITLWALGLAALTASVLHGAVVMVALVAMTTPMLLGATLLPRAFAVVPRRVRAVLPAALLAVSGAGLVLRGGAALDVIGHAHVGVTALGRTFTVMFW